MVARINSAFTVSCFRLLATALMCFFVGNLPPVAAQIPGNGENGAPDGTGHIDPPGRSECPYFKWQSKMIGWKSWSNIFTVTGGSRQEYYLDMWREFFSDVGLAWKPVESGVSSILKAKDKVVYECADGVDNDGDGAVDLKDLNCVNVYDASESGPPTECNDGIDNDGDGAVDYNGAGGKPADLSCAGSSQTKKETSGAQRQCQDKVDNDGDGLIDMSDPGCTNSQDHSEIDGTTQCQDGLDNDGDGVFDGKDPGCLDAKGKYVKTLNSEAGASPQCSDGIDNDGDGRIDWKEDADCTSAVDNNERGPASVCANGKDDDKDGLIDMSDPGCSNSADSSEVGGGGVALLPACSDGADNDGDGARDFPADKGCSSAKDANEGDVLSVCQNGKDDDGDGFVDYPADLGCRSSQDTTEAATKQQCQNGKDDDGDGLVDERDPGCQGPQDNTENSGTTACQDGRDNDGDGAVDFPTDFGCSSKSDNDEGNALALCQNGKDDDGDGAIDFPADRGCMSPQGNTEQDPDPKKRMQCENGLDDDKDGFIDMADPACDGSQDNLEAGITESAKEEQLGKYLTDYVKGLVAGTTPLPTGQAPLSAEQKKDILAAMGDMSQQASDLGACYGKELEYAREFAKRSVMCSGDANHFDDGFQYWFVLGDPKVKANGCWKVAQDWMKKTYGVTGSALSAGGQRIGSVDRLFYFTDSCEPVMNPDTISTITADCQGKLLGEETFLWYGTPISLIWDRDESGEQAIPTLVNFPLALDKPGAYWVWRASAAAPLLVYDPGHTGRISSATQLFGHWTFGGQRVASLVGGSAQQWSHGYAALATLDRDGNQEVSGEELRDLGLWFDANQNGISESGEVKPLASTGVTHLYLPENATYDPSQDIEVARGYRRDKNGRVTYGKSVDWTSRGAVGASAIMGTDISGRSQQTTYAKDVEVETEPAELSDDMLRVFEERVRGVWRWKMQSVAGLDPALGGMFLFDLQGDESHAGFAMTDAPVAGAGAIARIGVRDNFTWEISSPREVSFTVVKTPSVKLRNSATLSADGKTMHGETVGEERGQPAIRYRWTAFKESEQDTAQ